MKKLYILPILFGLLFGSCEDYLNVGSETELTEEQIFSTDEGFHKALTGIYVGMGSSSLYGSQLTWRMIEHFAHHYTNKGTGMNDYYFYSHNYTHSTVAPVIENVWNSLYNLIYRCNNILQKLEEKKADLHPVNYEMIKGEALALRAFFHFDLLRLFGHGDYANRSAELSNKFTIPYVTTAGKDITKQATYAEVFKNLKKDLNDAAQLLWGENGENCNLTYEDSEARKAYFAGAQGNSADFYTITDFDTKPRINYFAAKAILMRVLMWEGTAEGYQEILDFLEDEWELAENDKGMDAWDFSSRWNSTPIDRPLTQENFWHLYVTGLNDIIGEWFTYRQTDPSNVFVLEESRFNEIYEYNAGANIGLGDVRRKLYEKNAIGSYHVQKLYQYEGDGAYRYKNLIPLISTAELYYMAAEIYANRNELENALTKLNSVRKARGLTTDLVDLDADQIKDEILKEWRKEYIATGQLFYLYKRWNLETVYGTAMNDEKYVLPFPESEKLTGNREQFITEEE